LNVLLVRAGALGDILLLRPAVAGLRAAGHRVSLLAPSAAGAALVGHGSADVDTLVAWERADVAALLTEGELSRTLIESLAGFDAAVAYTRSALLARRLAALIARVIAHDPSPPAAGPHAALWLAQPLAELGVSGDVSLLAPVPTRDESDAARSLLSRLPRAFLVLHPGSGSASKNWPVHRFAALAAALVPREVWLLVEGPADADAALVLAGETAVVARHVEPRVVGAVLAEAGLYVGNDSGVSHLAAAWGAPTLALFGPTDPALWSPVGARVAVLRASEGRMDALELPPVLQAARRLYVR
jgi:heptosyltransferase-2